MCKLSYEKCVCFIFLVIVAFLSCSGFRIDKLAMTDISKRNTYTSNSLVLRSNELFSSIFENSRYKRTLYDNNPETSTTQNSQFSKRPQSQRPHRIRHAKKQKLHKETQAPHFENKRTPRGWIDAFVFPLNGYPDTHRTLNITSLPTTYPISEFAQIPPSNFTFPDPTATIINRSQRSPKRKKKNKRLKGQNCQEQDIARKAYHANAVVLAKAVSVSSNRESTYRVTFKVTKDYKQNALFNSQIRLKFSPNKRTNQSPDCESENANVLVKINIRKNKSYILFLKADGTHNYSPLGTPLIYRTGKKKQERTIEKVCKKDFAPTLKAPKLTEKHKNSTSLKIVCTAKGFPIPLISWKLNDTILQPYKSRTKITYLRRNSTLTIRNPEFGRYQCITNSADGRTTEDFIDYLPKSNKSEETKCNETYITTYCQNGGSCYIQQPISEMYCVCAEGFSGRQCEEKSSMYIEKTYTCKLGLSTTYYC